MSSFIELSRVVWSFFRADDVFILMLHLWFRLTAHPILVIILYISLFYEIKILLLRWILCNNSYHSSTGNQHNAEHYSHNYEKSNRNTPSDLTCSDESHLHQLSQETFLILSERRISPVCGESIHWRQQGQTFRIRHRNKSMFSVHSSIATATYSSKRQKFVGNLHDCFIGHIGTWRSVILDVLNISIWFRKVINR